MAADSFPGHHRTGSHGRRQPMTATARPERQTLRVADLQAQLGLSRTTIWRLRRASATPHPSGSVPTLSAGRSTSSPNGPHSDPRREDAPRTLRVADLQAQLGLSRTTIWRLRRASATPHPSGSVPTLSAGRSTSSPNGPHSDPRREDAPARPPWSRIRNGMAREGFGLLGFENCSPPSRFCREWRGIFVCGG